MILAGLVLSGVIIYGLVTFLSEQRNLALTLSGAAGIIVSIGVTVDSYVVLFERLKDEMRHGRTLRNSALRGFNNAWRTIVNADVTALIGALVLFWLSVGSVRGFAFFLAMSTIIDLIVLVVLHSTDGAPARPERSVRLTRDGDRHEQDRCRPV